MSLIECPKGREETRESASPRDFQVPVNQNCPTHIIPTCVLSAFSRRAFQPCNESLTQHLAIVISSLQHEVFSDKTPGLDPIREVTAPRTRPVEDLILIILPDRPVRAFWTPALSAAIHGYYDRVATVWIHDELYVGFWCLPHDGR